MASSTTSVEGHAISPSYVYYNGANKKIPVYEQSVSIIATLDRGDKEQQHPQSLILSLGLTKGNLPIVIGVCVGIVILITIIMVLLICSCRKKRTRKDHNVYHVQLNPSFQDPKQENNNEINQSDTMVVLSAGDRLGAPCESYLVDNMNNSISKTGMIGENMEVKLSFQLDSNLKHSEKIRQRPYSQPGSILKSNANNITEKFEQNVINYVNEEEGEEIRAPAAFSTQKVAQSCEFLDSTSNSFFTSTEDLESDEPYTRDRSGTMDQILRVNAATKSRSLPNWGRLKPRPLSTTDDIRELHAKVNYTKKRKNRMKNDSAAVIALTKSRTNILTFTDTESLVDNEAVVVYDERTAL